MFPLRSGALPLLIVAVLGGCQLDTFGAAGTGDEGPASPALDAAMENVPAFDAGVEGGRPVDAAPVDAQADAAPVDAQVDAPVDGASGQCTLAVGCFVLPTGFRLVAFDATSTASCPSGFAQASATQLVGGPSTAGACACQSCAISQQPSCASGAVSVFYDVGGGGGSCALPAVPAQNANTPAGQCGTDMYKGSVNGMNLKYVPPVSTGGSCTSAGQTVTQNVTFATKARVCQPDSAAAAGCIADQCTPQVPAPYAACIAADGSQTCPAPFTTKYDLGTDVSFTCPACPCATTAICTGTMTLYTDTNCSNGARAFTVDGQCRSSGINRSYASYKYIGTPSNVACTPGVPGAAQNVALATEQTICCRP